MTTQLRRICHFKFLTRKCACQYSLIYHLRTSKLYRTITKITSSFFHCKYAKPSGMTTQLRKICHFKFLTRQCTCQYSLMLHLRTFQLYRTITESTSYILHRKKTKTFGMTTQFRRICHFKFLTRKCACQYS